MSGEKSLSQLILAQWRYIVLILTPVLLCPLLVSDSQSSKCGYVMLLMSIYWMTEVTHLAITALIPVFLFPLLGILSTQETSICYMNSTNMIFFGGIAMALAVEYSHLHERIALFVILRVGQSPIRLIIGFILTTTLLSMWISNTAATAMMIPIVDAVVTELKQTTKKRAMSVCVDDVEAQNSEYNRMEEMCNGNTNEDAFIELGEDPAADEEEELQHIEKLEKFKITALLATAFAANLGGTGTLTGTNPNIVLTGFLEQEYEIESDLNYATWMLFAFPNLVLEVILLIGMMHLYTMDWKNFSIINKIKSCTISKTKEIGSGLEDSKKAEEKLIKNVLTRRYEGLGPVSFHEKAVSFLFALMVVLWFTRAPYFMPGWGAYFDVDNKRMVAGATPALLIIFLLFIIPTDLDSIKKGLYNPAGGLLTWQVVKLRFPWEVLLIMGGGFAMAKGSSISGLSVWISQQLSVLSVLPSGVAVFGICIITGVVTNVMSNTAVISIFLPVLKEMAVVLQVNPLYLMLPATLTASFAFILPVATPPNTLVFNVTNMKIIDMVKAGFLLNILSLLVLTFSINTYGCLMFDMDEYPAWANSSVT